MAAPITTKEQFERLPMLLTYSEVLACGLTRGLLKAYMASGEITFLRVRGGTRRRFRKQDVAKLLGFDGGNS